MLAAVLTGAVARASAADQALRAAQDAADHFDFPRAEAAAREGLASGTALPDTAWRLYAVLAESAASMGKADAAVEAFVRALELHPALDIPPDASPKLWGPFQRALRAASGQSLQLVTHATRTGSTARVHVEVRGDPGRLVDRLVLCLEDAAGGFTRLPLARSAAFESDVQCGTERCRHYVVAADGFGNELAWSGSPQQPLEIAESRGWARRHVFQLVGAGLALGVGAAFAVTWLAADLQLAHIRGDMGSYTFAEARAADQARTRGYAGFLISLGVTGLVLGSTLLW